MRNMVFAIKVFRALRRSKNELYGAASVLRTAKRIDKALP